MNLVSLIGSKYIEIPYAKNCVFGGLFVRWAIDLEGKGIETSKKRMRIL